MIERIGDADAPRLPPVARSPATHDSDSAASPPPRPADLGPVHQPELHVRRMEWIDYVEPALLPLRRAGFAVLGVRIAVASWAVALVAVAVGLRGAVGDRTVSTRTVSTLGLVGLLVAVAGALVGWYWADRATRNVHLLQARLPSRIRCASAWASPVVGAGLAWVIIGRLDPTEPVDVRPIAAGLVLALALWRPYSLVRRILASLIRVDSDLAIGSAYLLDLALLGLVSARLADLPAQLGPADAGIAGTLVALCAVAAVAAIGNVGVWYLLVRDVDRAVDHRQVAMRTRHAHRQLRLAGIDPLDPKVRLALLMIQQEWSRAELEPEADEDTSGSDAPHAASATSPPEPAGTADEEVPPGSPVSGEKDFDESGGVTERPAHETDDATEVLVPDGGSGEVGADADATESSGEDEVIRDVEVVGATEPIDATSEEDELAGDEVGDSVPAVEDTVGRIAARLRTDREHAEAEPAGSDRRSARRTAPTADEVGDRVRDRSRSGTLPAVAETVRERLAVGPDAKDGATTEERLDRLFGRLGESSFSGGGRSIFDRLERLGINPGDVAIPDDGTGGASEESTEERAFQVERLYSLELARYLLVLATAVCAVASAWFVTRAVDAGELDTGAIDPGSLDRLEVARNAAAIALGVALVLVPLWCALAARAANRAGLDVPGGVRCTVLTVLAGALVAVGLVADPTSNAVLFATLGCLGAALWSVPVPIDVERGFGRSTTVASLLPLGLVFAVLTAWIGGVLQPVGETDSSEAMSFFGGLLGLVMAITTVVAWVATGDVVEAIELSSRGTRTRRPPSDDRQR